MASHSCGTVALYGLFIIFLFFLAEKNNNKKTIKGYGSAARPVRENDCLPVN
jgi:hypothetical protein